MGKDNGYCAECEKRKAWIEIVLVDDGSDAATAVSRANRVATRGGLRLPYPPRRVPNRVHRLRTSVKTACRGETCDTNSRSDHDTQF